MTHKYKIGGWIRFYRNGQLVIGVINYLPKRQAYQSCPQYHTDIGIVDEDEILECRL